MRTPLRGHTVACGPPAEMIHSRTREPAERRSRGGLWGCKHGAVSTSRLCLLGCQRSIPRGRNQLKHQAGAQKLLCQAWPLLPSLEGLRTNIWHLRKGYHESRGYKYLSHMCTPGTVSAHTQMHAHTRTLAPESDSLWIPILALSFMCIIKIPHKRDEEEGKDQLGWNELSRSSRMCEDMPACV